MSSLRKEYMIQGYSVYFPYDAYDCQIKYMQKVLYSVENGRNALLESPTGTGKTMCLLASTLAYQKHYLRNNGPSKRRVVKHENVSANSGTYNIKSEGGMIEIVGMPVAQVERNAVGKGSGEIVNVGIEKNNEIMTPRVIYSSRTHSQLSQVMRELKSSGIGDGFTMELFDSDNENYTGLTSNKLAKQEKAALRKRVTLKGIGSYGGGCNKKIFKATILGSRDQLCVHPRVSKSRGNALIKNCRRITKEGKCRYHNNLKQAKISEAAADIRDIEDLRSLALSSDSNTHFCPYYATREIESVCNVVLLPYNYLLDSIMRQNLKIDLRNSILILDEAHNLESIAEEAYSYDLRDIDLALSQKAIQNILEATKLGILENKEKNGGGGSRNKNRDKREKDSENSEEDEEEIAFDIEVAISLVTGIHELSKILKEIPCEIPKSVSGRKASSFKMGEVQGVTYPGKHIYTLFGSAGFGKDNFQKMDECLTNMINYGQSLIGPGGNVPSLLDVTGIQMNVRIGALERFQRCLRLTFNETTMKNPQWFKIYVHYEPDQYMSRDADELRETGEDECYKRVNLSENDMGLGDDEYRLYLSFWCFSPAAALSSLASSGVRSMIITSGTLSPLDSLSQQFSCSNVSFEVFLENDHVIDSNKQLLALTVERGSGRFGSSPGAVQLVGSYEARNNPAYFQALGGVVLDTIRRTPGGVLLFFSSYPLMDQAIKYWNEQGLIERLKEHKSVFVEPRSSSDLGSILESYMQCVNKFSDSDPNSHLPGFSGRGLLKGNVVGQTKRNDGGSLLIAVCRGKVSEGINFSDEACRGVIVAGLPFPSISDPRVSLKKQYMDESNMDGRQWYNQQAIRAVNQAIGRVVRHKNDYGVIVLADKRFSQYGVYSKLSKWIRSCIKHLPQLERTQLEAISYFFNSKLGGGCTLDSERENDRCHNTDVSSASNVNSRVLVTTTQFNNNSSTYKTPPSANLSTEINSVLKLIGNDATVDEDSGNNSSSAPLKKAKTNSSGNSMPGNSLIKQNKWNSSSVGKRLSSFPSFLDNTNTFTILPVENENKDNLRTTENEKDILDRTKKLIGDKGFDLIKPHIIQIKKGSVTSSDLNTIANCLIPSTSKCSLESEFLCARKNLAFEYLDSIIPLNQKSEFKSIIENILLNIDLIKDEALVTALEKDYSV